MEAGSDVAALDAAALASEHFGSARLGDARRVRRLVRVAERVMRHPGGTLPQKLGGRAEAVGLYRLAACPRVTHAAVLAPHRRRTLGRMRRRGHGRVVLVVHDATELDFSTVVALRGELGRIGDGRGRGYVCHNSLAVTPDGEVLGLAGQVLHRRREVPRGEGPAAKRRHPGRESRLWVKGCEAVGPPPRGPGAPLWVDVCDRGADAVEFIEYELRKGRHFVIRCGDRNLDGEALDHVGRRGDRIHHKLLSYARDLPELGRRRVDVPPQTAARRRGARAARRAEVRVAAGPLALRASRFARGECRRVPLGLWVVHVAEVDPPPGVEPLEWVLLSDLPADTFGRACERVDWYGCRPVVEDYHKGMKTGVGVELPRFAEAARLEPVVALLSVAAAVLLGLRHAARSADADLTPAAAVAPAPAVRVLAAHRAREAAARGPRAAPPPPADMTARQFLHELAKLGGWMARKSDGPPGWLTLWRGWTKLQLMAEGAAAILGEKCVYD